MHTGVHMKSTYEDHTVQCVRKTEIHFPTLEGMKAAQNEDSVELGLDVFLEITLDSVSLQVQDSIVERGMQIHLPRLCMRALD